MELILKEDIQNLGFKDDLVKVKNGFGRNFLIPNSFAILANESNTKSLNELLKQTKNKQEEIINNAKELAKKIGELNIEIPVKVGSEDKMFGSITTNQISKLLSEKGFDIDKKNISFSNKVKNLGIYDVNLIIHKEITHPIKINITAKKAAKKKK